MSIVQDGFLRSAVRAPVNLFRSRERGSNASLNIHEDATAQKLGFRGGTIPGSIHMDQFVPVLVHTFGEEWFETGSLSLNFKYATTDREEVIAMVACLPERAGGTDVQIEARMERPDGTLVAIGTAGKGSPRHGTYLDTYDLRPSDPSQLRILHDVKPGVTIHHRARIESAPIAERIDRGGLLDALPGLFGAIEVRHHGGPVFLDEEYEVAGEVAAVGASPKTEYIWFDTRAYGPDRRVVASMRMQLRWMKASSPLYAS